MADLKQNSVKLVVVGDGAVGKTCLLHSYAKKEFLQKYIPTIFENYVCQVTLGTQTIDLGLMDTAGQEEYDSLRPLSYVHANILLICFSVVSSVTFENVTSKWLPEVRHFCPQVPIILVGTKSDLRSDPETQSNLSKFGQRVVTPQEGAELAKKIQAYDYIECSAATRENIKEVFDQSIRAALSSSQKKKIKTCTLV